MATIRQTPAAQCRYRYIYIYAYRTHNRMSMQVYIYMYMYMYVHVNVYTKRHACACPGDLWPDTRTALRWADNRSHNTEQSEATPLPSDTSTQPWATDLSPVPGQWPPNESGMRLVRTPQSARHSAGPIKSFRYTSRAALLGVRLLGNHVNYKGYL